MIPQRGGPRQDPISLWRAPEPLSAVRALLMTSNAAQLLNPAGKAKAWSLCKEGGWRGGRKGSTVVAGQATCKRHPPHKHERISRRHAPLLPRPTHHIKLHIRDSGEDARGEGVKLDGGALHDDRVQRAVLEGTQRTSCRGCGGRACGT